MPTINDAFSLASLTAAINAAPFQPFRIGQLGIFEEQGISHTSAKVEQLNGSLSLISTAPRGGSGDVIIGDKRREMTFSVPHIPAMAGIDADEMQDVRAFGSESTSDNAAAARDRLMVKMRSGLEMTIEAHRIGAIKGQVLDKDGSVLLDLFTTFGVPQTTVGFALATDATVVKKKVSEAIRAMESKLGNTPYMGVRVLCGDSFFDELSNHKNVEKFYLNQPAALSLTGDPLQAIQFGGVTWERYRGVSGCTIASDDAYLIPMGVPGLFITRYAPANYTETINTLGLPMYAKAEERKFGKGFDVEAQTNPLNLCTRPGAVIKLTKV